MSLQLHFKIVSPERVVRDTQVDQISLPTKMGEITILPHHIPLISSLASGEIKIKNQGNIEYLAVSGGFVEIKDNTVIVLADTAERAEEINEQRAVEAHLRAVELMKEKQRDTMEFAALAAQIEKELTRVKVARRRQKLG